MAQRFSGSVFFLKDMKIIGQAYGGFKRERKKIKEEVWSILKATQISTVRK